MYASMHIMRAWRYASGNVYAWVHAYKNVCRAFLNQQQPLRALLILNPNRKIPSCSIIHSFVQRTYIAPLLIIGTPSLTPALKNTFQMLVEGVCRVPCYKRAHRSEEARFHVECPTTKQARRCVFEVLWRKLHIQLWWRYPWWVSSWIGTIGVLWGWLVHPLK